MRKNLIEKKSKNSNSKELTEDCLIRHYLWKLRANYSRCARSLPSETSMKNSAISAKIRIILTNN